MDSTYKFIIQVKAMGKKRKSALNLLKLNNVTLIIVLIVVVAIFSVLNHNYFSRSNAMNILYASSVVGLLAIGQTYLIIGGYIDLSCASIASLSGVLAAICIGKGIPWLSALLITLILGAAIGIFNSILTNIFSLQPFIATLATASMCEGFGYIICGGRSVPISNQSFIAIGATKIFGIPLPVIYLVILFIIFGFILEKTVFGRSVYIIGGNPTAGYLSGINPKKVSTILYVISGIVSAFAGTTLAARMHTGAASAVLGSEFNAITAAVLGGVSFTGGSGSIGGCFIGLIIIQSFSNGLTMINVSSFWQKVAQGMLLIGALLLDDFRRKKLTK